MRGNKQVAGVGMAVAAAIVLLFLMSGKKAGAAAASLPEKSPGLPPRPSPKPLDDGAPLPAPLVEGPDLARRIKELEGRLAYHTELLQSLFDRPDKSEDKAALQREIDELRRQIKACCSPAAVVA